MHNYGQVVNGTAGTPDVDIDAPEAWSLETGGADVLIAMIDVGIQYDANEFQQTHPDLQARLWSNPNEIPDGQDNDGNFKADDIRGWNFKDNTNNVLDVSSHGHGTTISGIVAAIGNNATGGSGVLWDSRIMILKIGDIGGNVGTVANAMEYAVSKGARVSNNSYEITEDADTIKSVFRSHRDHLFVFAAGNGGNGSVGDNNDTDMPGPEPPPGPYTIQPNFACKWNEPNVICVTAVDKYGDKGSFANYGVASVGLGAPGVLLPATRTTGLGSWGLILGNGNGTSLAAPHVTGVAAMMMRRNPTYTPTQIKEFLTLSAQPTPTGNLDGKTSSGGMVNARLALNAFGDSFDDAVDLQRFFSQGPASSRWAVAQHGSAACDLLVKTVPSSADRAVEMKFSGLAGAGGTWSLASYEPAWSFGTNFDEVLVVRFTTPDGTSFSGKKGRIGVGYVGETGKTERTCAATGLGYTEATFASSIIAGIELVSIFTNIPPGVFMIIPPPLGCC